MTNLVDLARVIDDFEVKRTVTKHDIEVKRTKQVERDPVGIVEWVKNKTGQTFYSTVDDSYTVEEEVITEADDDVYLFYKYVHGISKQGKTTLRWLLDEKKQDTGLWIYIMDNLPQE